MISLKTERERYVCSLCPKKQKHVILLGHIIFIYVDTLDVFRQIQSEISS